MKRAGITLKDVAAAAKVSRATAARALNSYGYVGDETAARVLKVANSLGYRANLVAQALRRGQLPLVGYVPADIQNPFFARIAHDLEVELRKEGHNLLIASSEEDVATEKELLGSLRALSVRGYILAPTSATDNQHVVDLSHEGTPIVLIDRVARNVRCDSVVVDNKGGASEAVDYLVANGLCLRECRFGPSAAGEDAPGDADELFGKSDRQHVVMQWKPRRCGRYSSSISISAASAG